MEFPRTALLWLRRDLRLADNPALQHAIEHADAVVPVYIHAPGEEADWAPGAASRWWLHHSLAELSRSLAARGSRLTIRCGPSLETLRQLVRETGATQVCWNRLYEPAVIERDGEIKRHLRDQGLEVNSFNASLLFEPWTLANKKGEPYRVFTPFWKACLQMGVRKPEPAPEHIPAPKTWPESTALDTLKLLPRIAWNVGLGKAWKPGEAGAIEALDEFLDSALQGYQENRNRPDLRGSSRLSPHLHFGEIGPTQVMNACRQWMQDGGQARSDRDVQHFLSELGWREFAHHLLFHFPHTPSAPLDARFDGFPWPPLNPQALSAWQRGQTGLPIVDAGMRELWHTGWMHNRVRMIVASVLTKNLRIHWREGSRWFWDTLVDADLANNTLGWQWTAGCGADAAPYFRIFNPVLQGERFDPDGHYVRRWVPELRQLPGPWLHKPWMAPAAVLKDAGLVLDRDYLAPIVDLGESRLEALAAWEAIKARPVAS